MCVAVAKKRRAASSGKLHAALEALCDLELGATLVELAQVLEVPSSDSSKLVRLELVGGGGGYVVRVRDMGMGCSTTEVVGYGV
jgi:hypothetical protein